MCPPHYAAPFLLRDQRLSPGTNYVRAILTANLTCAVSVLRGACNQRTYRSPLDRPVHLACAATHLAEHIWIPWWQNCPADVIAHLHVQLLPALLQTRRRRPGPLRCQAYPDVWLLIFGSSESRRGLWCKITRDDGGGSSCRVVDRLTQVPHRTGLRIGV